MKRLLSLLLALTGCNVVIGMEDFTRSAGTCSTQTCPTGSCVQGRCVTCPAPAPTQACGRCGTSTAICDETTSKWTNNYTSCAGEGVCTVGDTQACTSGANPGTQVCSSSCQWSPCGAELTPLVTIPRPDGLGTFRIERHEVTRQQYAQFLAAPAAEVTSALGTPRDGCGSAPNPTYQPEPACLSDSTVCTTNCARHPQVCIDWCDAYAYCKWIGRRLCGKIGGGPSDPTQYNSLATSQWTAACVGTQGSIDVFPYGPMAETGRCNDSSHGCSAAPAGCTTIAVEGAPNCHGPAAPYDGIFDLSGNVAEWEDMCVLKAGTLSCQIRGGSFQNYPDQAATSLKCSGDVLDRPEQLKANPDVGFRCCAD